MQAKTLPLYCLFNPVPRILTSLSSLHLTSGETEEKRDAAAPRAYRQIRTSKLSIGCLRSSSGVTYLHFLLPPGIHANLWSLSSCLQDRHQRTYTYRRACEVINENKGGQAPGWSSALPRRTDKPISKSQGADFNLHATKRNFWLPLYSRPQETTLQITTA